MLIQFLEKEWPLHLASVEHHGRYDAKQVCAVKNLFPGCIFHNEDHMPHKLCVYCPLLYYNLLKSTFRDKAIFSDRIVTPALLREAVVGSIPKMLKRKYPWGFKMETGTLAHGYILPKSKKRFTTARPIIASDFCISGRLFQAAAKILSNLMAISYKQIYGNRTMPTIILAMHKFLQEGRDNPDVQFLMDNSDLKGFFTSVPADSCLQLIT
jgi:hypothetical protein